MLVPTSSANNLVTVELLDAQAVGRPSYVGASSVVQGSANYTTTQTLLPSEASLATVLPTAGTVTEFSATYTISPDVTLTGNYEVHAVLMYAPPSSNTFTSIAGSDIALLPTLTGSEPAGTIASSSTATISQDVEVGSRIIVAYYVTSDDGGAQTITGYASASYDIE